MKSAQGSIRELGNNNLILYLASNISNQTEAPLSCDSAVESSTPRLVRVDSVMEECEREKISADISTISLSDEPLGEPRGNLCGVIQSLLKWATCILIDVGIFKQMEREVSALSWINQRDCFVNVRSRSTIKIDYIWNNK